MNIPLSLNALTKAPTPGFGTALMPGDLSGFERFMGGMTGMQPKSLEELELLKKQFSMGLLNASSAMGQQQQAPMPMGPPMMAPGKQMNWSGIYTQRPSGLLGGSR